MHAMQVNSARRRRAGPPPAGSRPWQRELFKSVMLAPPPTQQQLAAAAGHACSRPSPARNVDPAGPHPPAALQAAAGRARSSSSRRRRRAEQDKRKPPRRTYSSAEIDHPLRVAAVNWRPAAAPAAAAFALFVAPPCSVAAAMANLLAAGRLAGCRSPASGRPGRRWIDLGC